MHPCPQPQPSIDHDKLVRVARILLADFAARPNAIGAFSGGKDSVVLKHLADSEQLDSIHWTYNVTTIDPPELVRFIHTRHPDVQFSHPLIRFFRLLQKNGPPTRTYRWCCRELKERYGPPPNGVLFTGVRAAESPRRAAKCAPIMFHRHRAYPIVNPIFQWTDDDVWHYIREHQVPYCPLYDAGMKRLGCVGCPMAYRRRQEIDRYPFIRRQWFDAMASFYNRTDSAPAAQVREHFSTFEAWAAWYWDRTPWAGDETTTANGPCQLLWSF